MSEDKPVDPFYKYRAKEIVDMLFDKRFLNDSLSRETVDSLEEFFGWLFQSQCESAVRAERLSAKFRDETRPKIPVDQDVSDQGSVNFS